MIEHPLLWTFGTILHWYPLFPSGLAVYNCVFGFLDLLQVAVNVLVSHFITMIRDSPCFQQCRYSCSVEHTRMFWYRFVDQRLGVSTTLFSQASRVWASMSSFVGGRNEMTKHFHPWTTSRLVLGMRKGSPEALRVSSWRDRMRPALDEVHPSAIPNR